LEKYIEIEDLLGLDYSFAKPEVFLPIASPADAELWADALRAEWNLGADPIHNVISVLESREIKVIEVDEEENSFDGLSSLADRRFPVIVVNKNFPVSASVTNLANR